MHSGKTCRGCHRHSGSILYYGKDYVEEGVRVIVKIWTKGKAYRFSDTYTVLLP